VAGTQRSFTTTVQPIRLCQTCRLSLQTHERIARKPRNLAHVAAADELGGDPADPAPAEHGGLTEVEHPETALGGTVELENHVVPADWHARGPLELTVVAGTRRE
jgi:hypothetical protein